MKKRILRLLLLAVLVIGAWWYYESRRPGVSDLEQIAQRAGDALQQATQDVSAPPPLRAKHESPSALLTHGGVLKWTNLHRRDNGGLPPLAPNTELNAAAEAKLKDLFAKQYFEHISPTGVGPSDLAKQAGYDYIVVGENLALGNFKDDQELVQAWMDSPGHRANILDASYGEIGIAVGQGMYEGQKTWIAVQEFGKPKSACPAVDAELQRKIDADEAAVKQMEAATAEKKAELEAMGRPNTREERDEYNRKIDEYNALVKDLNALISKIQGEIAVYNGQVQAYNACANS